MARALKKPDLTPAITPDRPSASPALSPARADLAQGRNVVAEQHLRIETAFAADDDIERYPPMVRAALLWGGSALFWAGILRVAFMLMRH